MLFCSYRLHFLRSWSLRQTRGAVQTDKRRAYVETLDITDFVRDQFAGDWDGFFDWKDSLADLQELDERRNTLINDRIAGAMAKAAAQGNANASRELARLSGQVNPVGRPKINPLVETRVAQELAKAKQLEEDYQAVIERMKGVM
ncbi:hypothetical protein GCM10011316_21430 [Roseibium aquae]|uniref:Uncharacterized protein n=1 Tax=Roseibium aquae TaxID=1323746 RepID=A0A916TJS8_9HYPH|nr:hypothetical protein [Roseibium aquae]GGB49013.1 hypothetical protein GCM10011316_21430 [Roseibium aquae]